MIEKPRLSLVRLSAEWFSSVVASQELVLGICQDGEALINFLSEIFDVVGAWHVNSLSSLEACCQGLRTLQADLVLIVFQVWAEDFYLHDLAEAIQNKPVCVWCYQPWIHPPRPANFLEVLRGSGPVGTLEGMGTLVNLGVPFQFVYGAAGEPRLAEELTTLGKAAQVRTRLRQARFGLLPYRNDQMHSTYVDEFRLRSELGIRVQYLSVADLHSSSQSIPPEEVEDYVHHLQTSYPIHNVSTTTLALSARASLGLIRLGMENGLDLVSLNDIAPELHTRLGLRPCLIPPHTSASQPLITLEGDLGAATAAYMLSLLAGDPMLFCEMWFWDEADNLVTMGHAGPQDPQTSLPGRVKITHDFEFHQSDPTPGAHYQFVAKPGQVTLLHLRATPKNWQAILTRGECVDLPPWVEGYPHAIIRLEPPVGKFLHGVASVGSTQHWIMAYGNPVQEVEACCRLLNIPLLRIE